MNETRRCHFNEDEKRARFTWTLHSFKWCWCHCRLCWCCVLCEPSKPLSNVDGWLIINGIDVIKISDVSKPVTLWHFAPASIALLPYHKTYAVRKISILFIEKHERKPLKHAPHESIERVHLFKNVEMSWNMHTKVTVIKQREIIMSQHYYLTRKAKTIFRTCFEVAFLIRDVFGIISIYSLELMVRSISMRQGIENNRAVPCWISMKLFSNVWSNGNNWHWYAIIPVNGLDLCSFKCSLFKLLHLFAEYTNNWLNLHWIHYSDKYKWETRLNFRCLYYLWLNKWLWTTYLLDSFTKLNSIELFYLRVHFQAKMNEFIHANVNIIATRCNG